MAQASVKVLVCPDKFKGTLDAWSAARAIASGWKLVRPADRIELLPISDGGDGFGLLLGKLLGLRTRRVLTVDAAHRRCSTAWWESANGVISIVESARVIGLAMLPPGRFHPFKLDTFGLGKVLIRASGVLASGVHGNVGTESAELLVGIGGSATNDAGFGMARALGWQFLDRRGRGIEQWTELGALAHILKPSDLQLHRNIVVAVDVTNPLLGPTGASRIYGPQKGLRRDDFRAAEKCLGRLASVVRQQFGIDYANRPGAGAAGGLGFGLMAFAGAEVKPGFDLFAEHAGLGRMLAEADLVITGEGSIDRSTLMGKGVGLVAARCAERGVPCFGLAGVVATEARTAGNFTALWALCDATSSSDAMARAAHWLRHEAAALAREFGN